MCENNSVAYQALKVKAPFIRNVGVCEKFFYGPPTPESEGAVV
jgi:hypothetical protein